MRTRVFFLIISLIAVSITLSAGNRITFYHGNYGMINETIELDLRRGLNEFTFDRIPSGLDEDTVILLPVQRNAFLVRTQGLIRETRRFNHLLRTQMNKEIDIVTTDGSIITGELFFFDNNLVGLRERRRNNTIFIRTSEIRNYTLKREDFDYLIEPHLSWTLNAEQTGKQMANLSYLTNGLSWSGIYKAVWEDNKLNLDIKAKISNHTEVNYQDFMISLVAGDPKRVSQQPDRRAAQRTAHDIDAMMMMESAAPEFVAEELGEFHIFSYTATVDIKNGETKQIRLYPPKVIEPEVYYEYITNRNDILIRLKVINDEESGLGIPLPRGTIQVYRQTEGKAELNFVGGDRVRQRPVNEEWIISPGVAFDLVGETKVLETRRPARNITEKDMSVTVKNRSKETKSILVTHNIRGLWTLERYNHPYERTRDTRIEFRRELQPDEEYEFTWTERIEH